MLAIILLIIFRSIWIWQHIFPWDDQHQKHELRRHRVLPAQGGDRLPGRRQQTRIRYKS